jgi:hypothetical protein
MYRTAVDQNPSAEAIAQRQEDDISTAHRGADGRLSDRREDVVVVDRYRQPQLLLELARELDTLQAGKIRREKHAARRVVDDARHTDADGEHSPFATGLANLADEADYLRDRRGSVVRLVKQARGACHDGSVKR